jgi:ATP synthase protein I
MTREPFEEEIRKEAERKLRGRSQRNRGIWFGLGMMGVVGWSVTVPTLLGLALGIWLDARTQDQVSWTITGLAVGLLVGCLIAWSWIRRESLRR